MVCPITWSDHKQYHSKNPKKGLDLNYLMELAGLSCRLFTEMKNHIKMNQAAGFHSMFLSLGQFIMLH